MTVTVFLGIGLSAFTFISAHRFQEQPMWGCATVDTFNDVVYPKYHTPIEHPGLKLFVANCKACHRLDQKLVGPALRNSFEARDSVWFVKMIQNANKLIDSGDTLANRLFNEYYQSRHPEFSFTKKELTDLVEFLRLEGLRDNQE